MRPLKMSEPYVLINDDLVPAEKASLLVSDLAIQRGYGIFDFFKALHHTPVFIDEHLDRFFHSAAELRLPIGKNREELAALLQTLMQKNGFPHSGIRLTLTGGYSSDGYELEKPNLIITQKSLSLTFRENLQKGLRLVSYPHQRQMPEVKTIDYLMAIWLQPYIRQNGADDVLYLRDGVVLECPRSNFFIVTGRDTLVTPSRYVLKGIIRMKVLELAGKQFRVEERDITLEEARAAKEAFITSTTKHILPVWSLDGQPIGEGRPGKVSQWLSDELERAMPAF
ncbi:MAG TPA: aminotransferase class IV [Puia sp.]|nr:aminotransferase class IV [Puia sp.]